MAKMKTDPDREDRINMEIVRLNYEINKWYKLKDEIYG